MRRKTEKRRQQVKRERERESAGREREEATVPQPSSNHSSSVFLALNPSASSAFK
jgi:hypothetical protein